MKIIKYFLEFILVINLFIIFKLVGINIASYIGSLIGKTIGPLFRSKKIITKNINIAFPGIEKKQEEKIINSMWSNYGRVFAEYMFLNKFRKYLFINNKIEIVGIEILNEIKKNKKPVVFFSGHFANFEIMAMALDKFGLNTCAIYRPLNNFFINPIMEYLRKKYICSNQIPKGKAGTRKLIDEIKNKMNIAIMVDQSVTEGEKIKFFNKISSTSTLPAQIAIKYNYKLVPIFLERVNGTKFRLIINKPFQPENTGNLKKDTHDTMLKVNIHIENMIKINPYQWIWSHNRWK